MEIRSALRDDLKGWSKLRTQLWPDAREQHDNELEEYFAGQSIDIADAFVLVNETDQICGFLELNIRDFAEGSRSSSVPYVEAWYVDSEYRGQGYGKQFMKHAEMWAQQKGFVELASDTEIENTESIAMHKKLGFVETERIVCFLKKI